MELRNGNRSCTALAFDDDRVANETAIAGEHIIAALVETDAICWHLYPSPF